MSQTGRRIIFFLGAALVLWVYVSGTRGLPGFGHYPGPYGDVINAVTVAERKAPNAVSAVNFDFRGFDTLGEEFILFASVAGVLALLRKDSDETAQTPLDQADDRMPPAPSDAVKALSAGLFGPILIFGLYTATHGQTTPGGGFQGGMIMASAAMLIYLGADYATFRRVVSSEGMEAGEGIAAGLFVLTGAAALFAGKAFLDNFLPLGQTGDVFSGGTIAVISVVTGMEVGAGVVLLMSAFFEQVFVLREGPER